MAKPPSLVVSALATWNGKALAKGKKEISQFDAATQKLGKTFAKVFGTIAVASFAKNAVNAFIESEKAAAKLRTTVKNLGLEFEQPGIEDYLKSLSLQFGIVDENLIPGFQRLLITTKDVAKAQSLFETALNVSAGTGKDLTTVATSLSKAYMGDNAALGKLGVGLSKAQLKSASFLDIQKTLNANFAGQASAAVQGYAGDMAKLTVAVDESKEAIGKGLLDALKALSGDTSIETFTAKLVSASETLGRYITNVAEFLSVLNPNNTVKVGGKFVRKSSLPSSNFTYGAGNPRADIILSKNLTKARKDEYAIIQASNKARSEIDKLKDKFDVERIGLMTALNAATDEETKLRIKAQLAILDNNEALAKKYNAELNAKLAADNLADAANKAASALTNSATKYDEIFNNLLAYNKSLGIEAGAAAGLAASSARLQAQADAFFASQAARSGSTQYPSQVAATTNVQTVAPTTVNVNVEGSVLSEQDLTRTIQNVVLVSTKYGNKYIPAGYIE